MKKIFAVLSMAFVVALMPAKAQPGEDFFNFGVKGGFNFTEMTGLKDMKQDGFMHSYTGFNAGLVFNFNLPLGFEINPGLIYVQSGVKKDGVAADFVTGSLRVPIDVQWGFRFLKIFKPYVVVSPYVGGVLFGNGADMFGPGVGKERVNEFMNRLQYGIGVGAGIYIWRFQVSFRWNWDLNPVFQKHGITDVPDFISLDNKKFSGGELSLAFFF